jgi:hypothetical protein
MLQEIKYKRGDCMLRRRIIKLILGVLGRDGKKSSRTLILGKKYNNINRTI